jgi:hypothetical protein
MSHSAYTEKLVRRFNADDEAAIHELPLRVAHLRARQDTSGRVIDPRGVASSLMD